MKGSAPLSQDAFRKEYFAAGAIRRWQRWRFFREKATRTCC